MNLGLLVVVVLAVPVVLVVALLAAVAAWAVLRPAEGEPPARARARRWSGTVAVTATAAAVLVAVPSVLVGLPLGAGLAGFGLLVAALFYVSVLWVGEAVSARPHTVRRTALLAQDTNRHRARTLLQAVLLLAPVGLLAVLGVGLLDDPGLRETLPVPVRATLPVAVLAVVVAGVVALAVRSVGRRAADGRLHPEVDTATRVRAVHRLLRAGSSSTCAALGLVLLATELQSRPPGDGVLVPTVVLAAVLVLLAVALSLLPLPALPLRADSPTTGPSPTADGSGSGSRSGAV